MRTLLADIALAADADPARIAAFDAEIALTRRDLQASIDRAAWAMSADGIAAGGVLGYFGGTGLDRIIALLAAQKIGAAFVPLDPGDPASVHEVILRNSRLTRIATTPALAARAFEIQATATVLPEIETSPTAAPFPNAECCEAELSLIKYTSGSTGTPKGAPSSRAAEEHFARTAVRMAGLRAEDRVAYFGAYKTWAIYAALVSGATIGCFDAKARGADALMAWLADQAISVIFCFPSIFRQMAATGRRLPALRHIQLVGEPVTRADVESFEAMCAPGAVLMNKYGSSENPWIAAHTHRHGDPMAGDILPMGRPVDPREVALEDAEGAAVPVGEVGEIVVDSDYAPECYHNDPERSAACFRDGPRARKRYHTGDLAWADAEGCLHSAGRKDDQIKIRGYTLRPASIELALTGRPDVAEAAVVAVEYPGGVRRLVCHFVGEANSQTLRAYLAERLPRQMIPNLFLRSASLPKTRTGKILRQELPSPFAGPIGEARETADP